MCVPRPMLANCFMNAKVSRLVGNVLGSGFMYFYLCWKIGKSLRRECVSVTFIFDATVLEMVFVIASIVL